MINFDYLLTRFEGDETRIYTPEKFPRELPNLVYIQGPNSSGKSTLLNIIALAFFGLKLKEDELPTSLREKLKDLIYSDHQSLVFSVSIAQ